MFISLKNKVFSFLQKLENEMINESIITEIMDFVKNEFEKKKKNVEMFIEEKI